MKHLFLVLFAFLGFSAFAQDGGLNLSVEGGAQIKFVEETINYGTIEQHSDGNREFVFTNTGKEPLIISKCQGSCGCTVPKCPTEPILPGETAKIKVKYATDRLGQFTKTVTVTSNAGEPTKVIKITGNVIPKEGGDDAK
ncbi:MAG: DUF1573 domain-containing protein [Chitinophagales bacterium]|nr:DUF1573 domain-containing protein [Chitinophagales bacterium]